MQIEKIETILNKLPNARDRVIAELLNLGYSEKQVSDLKITDDFSNIQDEKILNDIEQCKQENSYKVINKVFTLVDSDYLIRPVNIGKNSNKQITHVKMVFVNLCKSIGIDVKID